jgi:hypothetical protein
VPAQRTPPPDRRRLVGAGPRPFAVVGFTVAHGRIAAIDLIIDPEKLDRIVLGA